MSDKQEILAQLMQMSRRLGKPKRDYVILGDGNTSARTGDDTFLVKASGRPLRKIGPAGFVECRLSMILEVLHKGDQTDEQITEALMAARVIQDTALRPSIECIVHALALTAGGGKFVGHTHPVAWMSILCSSSAGAAISGRIFTEEILYCGAAPAFVPYADPGLPLGRATWAVLQKFLDQYGVPPKVILLQNHGLFALGQTAKEVENITSMSVKAARVLLGTYALGGPHFLTDQEVERINTRPDELFRRQLANQSN